MSMVYGLWSVVYGLWSLVTVYGLWSLATVDALKSMIYGPWTMSNVHGTASDPRYPSGDIRVPISESRYPSHDMRVTISESRYPSHDIRVMISESRIRGETRCALRPAAARRSPTGSESRYPRHEFAAGCESVGRAGGGRDGGRTVRGRRPRGPSPPRTMKMQSSTTLRSQQGTGIPTIFGTLFRGPGPPPPPVGHASDARGREQSRATDRSPRQRVSNASVSWTKA